MGVWFVYFLLPIPILPEPVEYSSSNAFKAASELKSPGVELRGAVGALL